MLDADQIITDQPAGPVKTLLEAQRATIADQAETIALLHDKIADLTRWLAATEAEWKAAMEGRRDDRAE